MTRMLKCTSARIFSSCHGGVGFLIFSDEAEFLTTLQVVDGGVGRIFFHT